jgi:hypothetical protein
MKVSNHFQNQLLQPDHHPIQANQTVHALSAVKEDSRGVELQASSPLSANFEV